jgi:hypothetical protein
VKNSESFTWAPPANGATAVSVRWLQKAVDQNPGALVSYQHAWQLQISRMISPMYGIIQVLSSEPSITSLLCTEMTSSLSALQKLWPAD